MLHSFLLRGVSAVALVLSSSSVHAQEALPADRTYVAGAVVNTNSLQGTTAVQTPAVLLANSTGMGILAGQPRAFIGGVKFKF